MNFTCPTPLTGSDRILLGHGSGGTLSAALLSEIVLPAYNNTILERMEDQATLDINGITLAFTTDSFVVKPIFFPGGDIGSLAVHGTINDLAMGGARPVALSVAMILEEGFAVSDLKRIAGSIGVAARACGVPIVTGDTKVVGRGSGDGIFLNTTGIGIVPRGLQLSAANARPGDIVILSGSIGDHGIAILAQREGLSLDSAIESDSAPLHTLAASILNVTFEVRCMRDPTRGGLSSTLNEIARQSGVGITIQETAVPVREDVRGVCELLGLDPLYVANEGKMVAIVPPQSAAAVLAAMRAHPLARDAAIIGEVTEGESGLVLQRTAFGTHRIVTMLAGDQLPRIC
uniref:Hydrogenase expression/formation protein HypE n=1 Tax=Solibacter usitatus (strain Ellin6076) TaxID=234267 RepID=Q01R77_SOLUE